jgi:hypothetical protein
MPGASPDGGGAGIYETLSVELSLSGGVVSIFDPVTTVATFRRVLATLLAVPQLAVAVTGITYPVTAAIQLPGVGLDPYADGTAWDPTQRGAFVASVAAYFSLPVASVTLPGLLTYVVYPSPPPPKSSPPPPSPATATAPPAAAGRHLLAAPADDATAAAAMSRRQLLAVTTAYTNVTVMTMGADAEQAAYLLRRWGVGLTDDANALFLQLSRYGVACSSVRVSAPAAQSAIRLLTSITVATQPGAVPGAAAATLAFQLNNTMRTGALAAGMRAAGVPVAAVAAASGYSVALTPFNNDDVSPPPAPAPPSPPRAGGVSPYVVPAVVGAVGGVALLMLALGAARFAAQRAARKAAEEDAFKRGFFVSPERAPRGPRVHIDPALLGDDDIGIAAAKARAAKGSRRDKRRIPAFGGDNNGDEYDDPYVRYAPGEAYGDGERSAALLRATTGRADSAYDIDVEAGRGGGGPRRGGSERRGRERSVRGGGYTGGGGADGDDDDVAGGPLRVAPRLAPRLAPLGASASGRASDRNELGAWAQQVGLVVGWAARAPEVVEHPAAPAAPGSPRGPRSERHRSSRRARSGSERGRSQNKT